MYVLSPQELNLRSQLEQQVKTGFVLRGKALEKIKLLKLYRDNYDTFEEYCDTVFGFTTLYLQRCIVAAQTYDFIEQYLETNSLNAPSPTKQSQLRPIFQAHLTPIEAGEVWVMAVNLALGQVPPQHLVKEAVKLYLKQKYPTLNPFSVGQICRIISGVPGKKNCWCVVSQVKKDECVVDTWDNQYIVSVDDLQIMKFNHAEQEQMLDLGERMTALFQVGELDEAAKWLLQGLERLNRSRLNTIEERLLRVLEEFYLFHDVE